MDSGQNEGGDKSAQSDRSDVEQNSSTSTAHCFFVVGEAVGAGFGLLDGTSVVGTLLGRSVGGWVDGPSVVGKSVTVADGVTVGAGEGGIVVVCDGLIVMGVGSGVTSSVAPMATNRLVW